jgi:hypothetical protein
LPSPPFSIAGHHLVEVFAQISVAIMELDPFLDSGMEGALILFNSTLVRLSEVKDLFILR